MISNVQSLRMTEGTRNIEVTKSDKNKAILLALGYTEEELASIGQGEIDELLFNATEVIVTEQYIKIDVDGVETIFNKEDCLLEIEEVENDARMSLSSVLPPDGGGGTPSTSPNTAEKSYTSSDGYMKILTSMVYYSSTTNP